MYINDMYNVVVICYYRFMHYRDDISFHFISYGIMNDQQPMNTEAVLLICAF